MAVTKDIVVDMNCVPGKEDLKLDEEEWRKREVLKFHLLLTAVALM